MKTKRRVLGRIASGLVFKNWLATRDMLPSSIFYEGGDGAVFLVSYPKSGNTWLRFIVANLMSKEGVTFDNIDDIVPDAGRVSVRGISELSHPKVVKSHSVFDSAFGKVIYIVRDPRDVFISEFHYHKKYGRLSAADELGDFLERFLTGELTPVKYGNWQTHVASWSAMRDSPNMVWIRYEDLYNDDAAMTVMRVADLIGKSATLDDVQSALHLSSSDRMRKLETDSAWTSERRPEKDKRIPFVREARTGQWKGVLSKRMADRIEEVWRPWMIEMGYLDS